MFYRKTKIFEFILDETQIKVGSELIWLWVAIEPESKEVLRLNISKERNMFVAERFLSSVIKEYMENIRFLPMAIPGIHKPVNS